MPSRRLYKPVRQMLVRTDSTLRRELQDEMRDTGKDMQREFKKVVSDWRTKPRFTIKSTFSDRDMTVTVEPEGNSKVGNIWRWIDKGTGKYGSKHAPYLIRPKPSNASGLLKFRTNYSPRTVPIAKFGQGSGSASGEWRSAKVIIHPGIKAREFTKKISDDLNPSFKQRIDNSIRRAIRRAN